MNRREVPSFSRRFNASEDSFSPPRLHKGLKRRLSGSARDLSDNRFSRLGRKLSASARDLLSVHLPTTSPSGGGNTKQVEIIHSLQEESEDNLVVPPPTGLLLKHASMKSLNVVEDPRKRKGPRLTRSLSFLSESFLQRKAKKVRGWCCCC